MIIKLSFYSSLLSVLLVLSISSLSFGHTMTYVEYKDRMDLMLNESILVSDPQRFDPVQSGGDLQYVADYQASIHLIYGREKRTDVQGKYWSYRIQYELYESTSTTPDQTGTLTISHYDGKGIYEAIENYSSTTGAVRLVITNIEGSIDEFQTSNNSASWINQNIPEDIRLELRMNTQRYDFLSSNTFPSNHKGTYFAADHNFKIQWSHVPGAESYEIEWAYQDEEVILPPTIDQLFSRAAKVEVIGNEYDLSVTYPEGTLYYRIRAIGRFIRNIPDNDYSRIKTGAWTPDPRGYILQAFETDKNWQYTTTFAEEGKYKKVISYYDEGLKNRQTQTNLSTEETTLVATSHYDVEGRPSLSILPVPALNNNQLFYKPKFNENTNGQTYNRINFDKNLGNGCQYSLPDPLSNTKGAAYYFDPNHANGSEDDLYKEMIPDADQYPMTQVRFLNDGTGRIAAQSGVGEFFQLGSERETRYFYDDPSSVQLHRLFGSNVGQAKYYKRNLVMDANGQLSVSYVDIAGRVIATALTGVAPSNIETLNSYGTEIDITENLLDNNVIIAEERISKTISTVMNEEAGKTATFTYKLDGLNEQLDPNSGGSPICLSCDYQLTIRVYDPCGELVELDQGSGGRSNFINQLINGSDDCTNPLYSGPDITFDIVMNQIGLYRVEKFLEVIELEPEAYLNILANNNEIPSIENLLSLVPIDSISCYLTCGQRCRLEIMASNGGIEPTEAEINNCIASYPECQNGDLFGEAVSLECDALYNTIINQVAPGGCKYEQGIWWGTDIDVLQFPKADGTMGIGANSGMQDTLQDPTLWEDGWEDVLATIHPEYCQYLLCKYSDASRKWDRDFQTYLDWNGVVWPSNSTERDAIITGLTSVPNSADPMYSTSLGFYPRYDALPLPQNMKDEIETSLETILNINISGLPNPATTIATKLSQLIQNRLSTLNGSNGYGWCPQGGGGSVPADVFEYLDCNLPNATDAEKWEAFRGIYLGEKNKLRNRIRRLWCSAVSDECSIIGDSELYSIPEPTLPNGSNTEEAGNDFILNNNPNTCASICEFRVEEWLQEILTGCPDLATNTVDLELIRNNLMNYCTGSCGPGNPMAYLLTEDLANTNNNELQLVKNTLSSHCNGEENTVLDEVAVPFTLVYEYYKDDQGNDICEDITTIDPCFITAIQAINTHIIQANNCPGTYTFPGESNCFSSITVNGDFSIDVTWADLSACCSDFTFFDVNNSSIIDPCTLTSISSPWVNGTDIFVRGYLGATTVELRIDCVSPNGFLGGEDFVAGPNEACLFWTENICYVVPKEEYIDIDTLWQECIDEALLSQTLQAEEILRDSIDQLIAELINQRNCLDGHAETFTVSYPTREHHYTLYYYDQAGNLIETVPPEGVVPLSSAAFPNDVWDGTSEPSHLQRTKYQYNTLGQVVWQNSPDGGATEFKYDYAQRLRVSENAKQKAEDDYSYTRYDAQGRIIEVGELENPKTGSNNTEFDNLTAAQLNDFAFPRSVLDGDLSEQTFTAYNSPSSAPGGGFVQDNLRGRVAMTSNASIKTHYSYDEHGNVKALQHEIVGISTANGQEYQVVEYDYDLISGNVKEVAYQAGKIDQFYHRYDYDADNRLTEVYTSENGWLWDNDARYFYYAHGPLARVEIGEDKIQGMDYYYSLQGWIKGVNATGQNSQEYEVGKDGHLQANNRNQWLARDAYGYSLHYYDGDYTPIGTVDLGAADNDFWTAASGNILDKTFSAQTIEGLFNGNIVGMITDVKQFNNAGLEGLQAMSYRYDQLHRIKEAFSYNAGTGSSQGNINFNNINDYRSNYSYDANGNLKLLNRWGPAGQMDQLAYTYSTVKPNQLSHVDDGIASGLYGEDVDDQNVDNYGYDAIGNLTKDVQGQVDNISWTVYGKVNEVTHALGTGNYEKTVYLYDPAGNRLSKKRVPRSGTTIEEVTTYYIRDASGNVLSIYEQIEDNQAQTSEINQKEVSLYGSARLGHRKFIVSEDERKLGGSVSELIRRRGQRAYEMSNHLGNVLSVVSDYKEGVVNGNPWEAEYYESLVLSANDYYAFGLEMPERKFNSPEYRYGFNGKEKDESGELGNLTHYDYGFRIYNPGISRFLSIDPLTRDYSMLTPYQFASNSPVSGIDLDGLEYLNANQKWVEDSYGGSYTHVIDDVWLYTRVEKGQTVFYHNVNGHWQKIQSSPDDPRFNSYLHQRTHTGYGLSVAPNYLNSDYTDPIGNVALVGIGGSLILGTGGSTSMLREFVNLNFKAMSITLGYESVVSLWIKNDLSLVDDADILISGATGFWGGVFLGGLVDFSEDGGFKEVTGIFGEEKSFGSFAKDIIAGVVGKGTEIGLKYSSKLLEEASEGFGAFAAKSAKGNAEVLASAQKGNVGRTSLNPSNFIANIKYKSIITGTITLPLGKAASKSADLVTPSIQKSGGNEEPGG